MFIARIPGAGDIVGLGVSFVIPNEAKLRWKRTEIGNMVRAIDDYKTALIKNDPPLNKVRMKHARARIQELEKNKI